MLESVISGIVQFLATLLITPLAFMALVVPILIYVIARSRDRQSHTPDPQLGFKVAVHMFRVLAFQLALVGVFLFLFGIFEKGDGEAMIRLGLGVLLPAALLYGGHRMVATRSNDNLYPNVRHMFDGWNLIQTGLSGMLSLIAFFVVLIGDHSGHRGDMLRVVFPYLLAYFGGWAVLGSVWLRDFGILGGGGPLAGSSSPVGPGAGPTVPPRDAGGP